MTRTPVDSSNLSSVGYDPAIRTLEIEFKSGKVYRYFNVPAYIFDDLVGGQFSPGKYFNTAVKKSFRFEEIDEDPDPIAA